MSSWNRQSQPGSRRPAAPASSAPDHSLRRDSNQALGEAIRAAGGAGIIYDSLRHVSGVDVVAHRPRNVLDAVQTDHFRIAVQAASKRIDVKGC